VVVVRVRVVVSGMVQGVFFRQETSERAGRLGVAGWVRNRSDGRVEAVFEGPHDAVDRLVSWCHQGTPWSRVERVEVTDEEPEGLDGFRIQ
jgi:acylphosphatase